MTRDQLPTGVVTFLMSDVEASAEHWASGPHQMTMALRELDSVIAEVSETHGGVRPEVRGEGDSHFVVFERPSAAVAAACEMQQVTKARRPRRPRATGSDRRPCRRGQPVSGRLLRHRGQSNRSVARCRSRRPDRRVERGGRPRSDVAHGEGASQEPRPPPAEGLSQSSRRSSRRRCPGSTTCFPRFAPVRAGRRR